MLNFSKLPTITLKWSQTIDGQLADDLNQSQWISGPEERRYTHYLRSQNDAVMVGAQTYLKDLCKLTVRDVQLKTKQPARIILDPKGRVFTIALNSEAVRGDLIAGDRNTYILTNEEISHFDQSQVIVIGVRFSTYDQWVKDVLSKLVKVFFEKEGYVLSNLMVEGGAATLTQLLKLNLVNKVELSISPLILGGESHRVYTKNLLKNVKRFKLESIEQLGADVLLKYSLTTNENIKEQI